MFAELPNEAQRIVSNTAAGPLEDLLANHDFQFIDAVEVEARQDRRMFWALGAVWKNSMTDAVWERVERAAGGISR